MRVELFWCLPVQELGVYHWSSWSSPGPCSYFWEWRANEQVFITQGTLTVTPYVRPPDLASCDPMTFRLGCLSHLRIHAIGNLSVRHWLSTGQCYYMVQGAGTVLYRRSEVPLPLFLDSGRRVASRAQCSRRGTWCDFPSGCLRSWRYLGAMSSTTGSERMGTTTRLSTVLSCTG